MSRSYLDVGGIEVVLGIKGVVNVRFGGEKVCLFLKNRK